MGWRRGNETQISFFLQSRNLDTTKAESESRDLDSYQHIHFFLPGRGAGFCKWLIEQPKLYRFFTTLPFPNQFFTRSGIFSQTHGNQ